MTISIQICDVNFKFETSQISGEANLMILRSRQELILLT